MQKETLPTSKLIRYLWLVRFCATLHQNTLLQAQIFPHSFVCAAPRQAAQNV